MINPHRQLTHACAVGCDGPRLLGHGPHGHPRRAEDGCKGSGLSARAIVVVQNVIPPRVDPHIAALEPLDTVEHRVDDLGCARYLVAQLAAERLVLIAPPLKQQRVGAVMHDLAANLAVVQVLFWHTCVGVGETDRHKHIWCFLIEGAGDVVCVCR